MLLGTAHTARERASAHMRPIQRPDDDLRRRLVHTLGAVGFDDAYHHGERLPAARALHLAPSDRRDDRSPGGGGRVGTALGMANWS